MRISTQVHRQAKETQRCSVGQPCHVRKGKEARAGQGPPLLTAIGEKEGGEGREGRVWGLKHMDPDVS